MKELKDKEAFLSVILFAEFILMHLMQAWFWVIFFLFLFVSSSTVNATLNRTVGIWGFFFGGAIYSIFVVSFFSELFYRGLLYPALRKRLNFSTALVLNAAVYSVIPLTWDTKFYLTLVWGFAIGAVACFIYEKSKSLTLIIAFHGLCNLVAIIFRKWFLITPESQDPLLWWIKHLFSG